MIKYNEAAGYGRLDTMKVPNIDSVIQTETKKHGKKSAAFTLINELGQLDLNDIAIYAGMYLAGLLKKPYWTIDEIKDQLTRGDFVDEKLMPLLTASSAKFKNMDEKTKKAKAMEIAQSIIDNESETVTTVNEFLMANSKSSTLAHQLTKGQLGRLVELLTKVVDRLGRMYGEDEPDVQALVNGLTWNPDNKETTSAWLNAQIKEIDAACGVAVKDLKDMVKGERDDKRRATIISATKVFEGFMKELGTYESMGLLWPESDTPIDGLKGIAKYVRGLESEREQAKEIIDQYEKRKELISQLASEDEEENAALSAAGWSDEKVQTIVNKEAKAWASGAGEKLFDEIERSKQAQSLAAEMLKKHRGLEEYIISQDHPDPESELAGIIGKRMASADLMRGRPNKQETI